MSNLFFCVWMIPVLLHIADCGKFELIAPSNEIIAEAGGTIVLPCYIKSRISAENMIVEWFRNGRLVHRYTEGRDDYENQDPTFRMRTYLFKEELETGIVSLKLLVVKGTDEGNYTCSVTSPTTKLKDDLNIKVNVKAVGSQPDVSIEGHREAGMGLVCETQGWHPEPEMFWQDNDGFPLPAGPPQTTRDSKGLYTLRLRAIVQKTESNLFTCTVKHKYMERDMTAMIHVPDELFYQNHTWKWVLALVFGVFLSAAAAFIYFLLKRQKEQRRLSQEKAKLNQDMTKLSQEKEKLSQEEEKLSNQMINFIEKLSQEEEKLSQEEVNFIEKLSQEKDDILQEKEKLSQEKDDILQEKEKLSQEKDSFTENRIEKLSNQMKNLIDDILQEREKLSNQMKNLIDDILQEKEKLIKENATLRYQMDLVNKRGYQDFGVVRRNAVDVILDPDTAHPNLILSADGKQVSYGDKQDRPDIPQRFDERPLVLGRQSFSSGQFYYEVQVNNQTQWLLGVAKQSCKRNGYFKMRPSYGYWTISLRKGGEYKALGNIPVHLHLSQNLQKVGVFVDYEDGRVSFYNVEANIHIFSFTNCCFEDKLYPIFSPYIKGDSVPLVICPVDSDKPESLHLSESQAGELTQLTSHY